MNREILRPRLAGVLHRLAALVEQELRIGDSSPPKAGCSPRKRRF